ncbi:MAG: serine/threonine-protein kinase [Verrucomicrobiales bacterium]
MSAIERALPRYQIQGTIGRGGNSIAYEAHDLELDRLVAIKIIPIRDDMLADSLRVRRERAVMAKLVHRHAVTLYDAGSAPGFSYLILERMEGGSVARALLRGKFSVDRALQVTRQVCSVLEYIHDSGIVHRDIKPSNILLDRDGVAKLADFGLVSRPSFVAEDITLTSASRLIGTPQYAAPEMSDPNAASIDGRADIYSLGVVLYEMVTGLRPSGSYRVPSSIVPECRPLDAIIERAMEPRPGDRFQTAADFAHSLNGDLIRKSKKRSKGAL